MEEKKPQLSSSRAYYLFAFKIIGDFGATIAIPVVTLVLIGQYFDKKYSTSPWLTVLAFVLSAFISVKIIYKKAKTYGEEYKKLDENKL